MGIDRFGLSVWECLKPPAYKTSDTHLVTRVKTSKLHKTLVLLVVFLVTL